jgi:hypothetical protein
MHTCIHMQVAIPNSKLRVRTALRDASARGRTTEQRRSVMLCNYDDDDITLPATKAPPPPRKYEMYYRCMCAYTHIYAYIHTFTYMYIHIFSCVAVKMVR